MNKSENHLKLSDPGEPDYYFFLNDSLPEDRAIREHLHNCRLQEWLKIIRNIFLTFWKFLEISLEIS